MRKLMSLVTLAVIAALGWGAYWYVGATVLEKGLGTWIEQRRAEGWTAEAATVDTRGFPNRFDTTFEALNLADPETGLGWSAPLFQLFALSYKPTHIIAYWPGEQRLTLPTQEITFSGDPLRGSFEFAPDPALPVNAVTLQAENVRLISTAGWQTGFAAGQISMRATPDAQDANSYDLFIDATDIEPTAALREQVGTAAGLPERIAGGQLNATVIFDKRWDRSAIEDGRPQPQQVSVKTMEMHWGDVSFSASGALEIDAEGVPAGQLDATVANWRVFLAVLEASQQVEPGRIAAIEQGLTLLATMNGDPNVLEVPLVFADGVMRIGPVPVMAAPILALP